MFKPGWKMTLFTLALSPLLFTLGQWQLVREQEKIQLQNEYERRDVAQEVDIEQIDPNREDLAFVKVKASGRFLNETIFLLDNRIHEGRVGYELLNPFLSAGGSLLLINRGWIAQGVSRDQLPELNLISEDIEITGSIYVPLEAPFLLSDIAETGDNSGPTVIQSIDMGYVSAALEKEMFPYTVRLSSGSSGLEQANWQTINMAPETHRGYAVQWFAMLIALLLMYIYFGFKNPRLQRNRE